MPTLPGFGWRALALGLAVALTLAGTASAQSEGAAPYPAFTGYVVDPANALDPASRMGIEALASRLDHQGFAQLAVCVVSTLGNISKEEYSNELFRRWGLGHGKKSDGVLILIVPGPPGHRKIRVEVGYGMEGLLNDGKVGALLDQYAVPELKQDAYGRAALRLSEAIAGLIEADARAGGESAPGPDGLRGGIGAGQPQSPRAANDLASTAVAVLSTTLILLGMLFFAARGRTPPRGFLIVALLLAASALVMLGRLSTTLAGWAVFAGGLFVDLLLWRVILTHRCPKCGGWLEVSRERMRAPGKLPRGTTETVERCAKCGYTARRTDRDPPRRSRGSGGGGVWWGGGGGGWSGGGGGGGWSGGDSGGGFSGGGGGDSGGGGAGRDV